MPAGEQLDLEYHCRLRKMTNLLTSFRCRRSWSADAEPHVLAANPIARALSPGFTPGTNFLRWRNFELAAREFFVDWDEVTDVAVSGLREAAGQRPG